MVSKSHRIESLFVAFMDELAKFLDMYLLLPMGDQRANGICVALGSDHLERASKIR
jgi:hypothetical protein